MCVAAWGRAADRFGRRPVLLVGLLGTAISQSIFGIAQKYEVALAARFLTGMLNGNVAIAKVYMGEITDRSNQARSFAALSFTWGVGTVTAPALGGWLADPAAQYPDSALAKIPLLVEYPYILPALVSVVLSSVTFLVGFFLLPETAVWERLQREKQLAEGAGAGAASSTAKKSTILKKKKGVAMKEGQAVIKKKNQRQKSATENNGDVSIAVQDEEEQGSLRLGISPSSPSLPLPSPFSSSSGVVSPSAITGTGLSIRADRRLSQVDGQEEEDDNNMDESETAALVEGTPSKHKEMAAELAIASGVGAIGGGGGERRGGGGGGRKKGKGGIKLGKGARRAREDAAAAKGDMPPLLPRNAGFRDILRDRAVMIAISNYGVLAFCQILFDELLPVFAKTDTQAGGLGWKASDVGSLQVVQGGTQIFANLVLFHRLTANYGLLRVFRNSMWPLIPVVLLFPALSRLSPWPEALWIGMAIGVAMKAGLMSVAFTSIMLIINNSSRGVALGAINGVAQSAASLVRALGPTLGGVLYSASLNFEVFGSFRLHTVYGIMAVLACATFFLSFWTPAWCNEAPDFNPYDDGKGSGDAEEAASLNEKNTAEEAAAQVDDEKGKKEQTKKQAAVEKKVAVVAVADGADWNTDDEFEEAAGIGVGGGGGAGGVRITAAPVRAAPTRAPPASASASASPASSPPTSPSKKKVQKKGRARGATPAVR